MKEFKQVTMYRVDYFSHAKYKWINDAYFYSEVDAKLYQQDNCNFKTRIVKVNIDLLNINEMEVL